MSPTAAKTVLKQYQTQVLRWNRQINLISRRDSEAQLRSLVGQCWNCLDVLLESARPDLKHPDGLLYFDLGSGAGLPGVVWHALLAEKGYAPRTCLVEPREKRAWFLQRVSALAGMRPFAVFQGRWGDTGEFGYRQEDETAPGAILISLKALHLTDPEVLDGLAMAWGPAAQPLAAGQPLQIARFYPGGQVLDPALAADLMIPAAGSASVAGALGFEATDARILSPTNSPGVSLVLSSYRLVAPA
jgi:hypothetical protein